MAFFGITHLGYQNPFGDRMLQSTQIKLDIRDSPDRLLGIQDHQIRYVRRSPKDLYRVPVTENQLYGWWITTNGLKKQERWSQTHRYPRKNSEMTRFVNEMSVTNPDFSLF